MENKDRHISFSLPKKSPLRIIGKPFKINDNKVDILSVAFDPEGKQLAVAGFDGSLKLYSPGTGKL